MSDRRLALLIALALVLFALGLGVVLARHSRDSRIASPVVASAVAVVTPGRCQSVNGLPDSVCSPGATDPRVTQGNIRTTICTRGYTAKVRPSTTYTDALKRSQIRQYGYTDTNPAHYEEDHLIPLELGGHPSDPKNLWPEPLDGPEGAFVKDGVENSLNTKVCAGLIRLADAQKAIAENWQLALR